MRLLVLLLLLANLAIWLWFTQYAPPRVNAPTAAPPAMVETDVPRLALLKEIAPTLLAVEEKKEAVASLVDVNPEDSPQTIGEPATSIVADETVSLASEEIEVTNNKVTPLFVNITPDIHWPKPKLVSFAHFLSPAEKLWQQLKDSSPVKESTQPVLAEVGSEKNLLESESMVEPELAASSLITKSISTDPIYVCYQTASEQDKNTIVKHQQWWQNKAAHVQLLTRRERQFSAYWVYLPPFDTRREAQRAERRLERSGIYEHMLVTGDEFNNAISLGMFDTEKEAQRHLATLRGKGYYQAKVDKRYTYLPAYSLLIAFNLGVKSENDLQSFADTFNVRLPFEGACKEIAITTQIP